MAVNLITLNTRCNLLSNSRSVMMHVRTNFFLFFYLFFLILYFFSFEFLFLFIYNEGACNTEIIDLEQTRAD